MRTRFASLSRYSRASPFVLGLGKPNAMYHRETQQEDFLVLSAATLPIVEGQERPLPAAAAFDQLDADGSLRRLVPAARCSCHGSLRRCVRREQVHGPAAGVPG
jgi:hypothetical protein